MDPTTSRLLGERSTTEPPLHDLFRRKKNEFELKPFWQIMQLILVPFLVKNDAFFIFYNTDTDTNLGFGALHVCLNNVRWPNDWYSV